MTAVGAGRPGITPTGADRPRSPGYVYGVLSLVMLLFIAAIALTARQPPPPTIAEFAPQAVDQIKDAPQEQSSRFGAGEGGDGEGGGTTTTTTTAPPLDPAAPTTTARKVVDVARVRKCVGEPPRQIEDPQSPPCVNYFEGDNGGATSKGVTATDIRIALGTGSPWIGDQAPKLIAFFNRRFEFYGRKMVLVEVETSGDDTSAAMLADAKSVDEMADAFALWHYRDRQVGGDQIFYDELAKRRIISVTSRPSSVDEKHYQSKHPYQWSYMPSLDVQLRNEAAWICGSLAGRTAQYAGGDLRDDQRRFGLIYSSRNDGNAEPNTSSLLRRLEQCGVKPAAIADQNEGDTQSQQQAILAMQTNDVTSIICVCGSPPAGAATNQAYFPEWIVSSYLYQDQDLAGNGTAPTQQWEQAIGISWWSKQLRAPDSPWTWALREADPSFQYDSPPTDYYDARYLYESLLVIASGIQMAGPDLTPASFARGLQTAKFPNPGFGGAPYYQGHISFGPSDHTAVDDAQVIWWSGTAVSAWGGTGTWCSARNGTRYGERPDLRPWPTDDGGLKQPPCT